jgi:thiamine biosynthesis protein ThiI
VPLVTVHYHELALKGGNRPRFQRTLQRNLLRSLRGTHTRTIRSVASRFLVDTAGDLDDVLERIVRVPGVAHAMPVRDLPRDVAEVGAAIAEELERRRPKHFRISTRRIDKRFPMISMEVDRAVGAIVAERTGIPVRLKEADVDVHVTVLVDRILAAFEKREGTGGLPVGTGGRVAALMSGGIDSPVAA